MAPSNRRSNARDAARASHGAVAGPVTYQTALHPLTPGAKRLMHALPQAHSYARLRDHIKTANAIMTDAAGEANDRLALKEDLVRRRRAKRVKDGLDEEEADDEQEQALRDLRRDVGEVTGELEAKTRVLVDLDTFVMALETELARASASYGGAEVAPPGGTQSSNRRRRRRGAVESDEDDERNEDAMDEDYAERETQEAEATAGQDDIPSGPLHHWQKQVNTAKQLYEKLSMYERYARHNNYVGFKRIVHDAQNPGDEAPPVPAAETWFPKPSQPTSTSTPAPSPSSSTQARRLPQRATSSATLRASPGSNDDDDLAITADKTSLTCPLTLLPFTDPVRSTKCPHSFEKSAILEMISHSTARLGGDTRRGRAGAGGEKAVQCPVCEQMLTAQHLVSDPVLLRKVRRLQELHAEREDEDEDEDGDGNGSGSGSGSGKREERKKGMGVGIGREAGEMVDADELDEA